MLRALGLIGLAALAACYSPPSACGITCAATNECPGDAMCMAGVCVSKEASCPGLQIRAIGAGSRHTCVLESGGALYCWGDNRNGQVGTGTSELVIPTPTRVGTDLWAELSVGASHSCAVRDGDVYCWGQNGRHQADGMTNADVPTPRKIEFPAGTPPPRFEHVSAGSHHTCAIGAGQLWCWGDHNVIAPGSPDPEAPARVGALEDWTAISVGFDAACGFSGSLGIACWGSNGSGQAGQPPGTPVPVPTTVPLPAELAALTPTVIEMGDEGACTIASGQLWCWGADHNDLLGNMGMATGTPMRIGADDGWTAIRVGGTSQCGIGGGIARCWGHSGFGGLGGGKWQENRGPDEMVALGPATAVTVGIGGDGNTDENACLLDGASASCWGDNTHGALGVGRASRTLSPVEVTAPSGATWKHVTAGIRHVCALTDNRDIYCWGLDGHGQIANGPGYGDVMRCAGDQPCTAARPTRGPSGQKADDLSVGRDFTCARDGREIKCWGDAAFNFLGGAIVQGIGTVRAPDDADWIKLVGSTRGSCGTTATGVACWGDIGMDTTNVPYLDPGTFAMAGDVGFADNARCIVRLSDNRRVCFGTDANGRLGNGADGDYPTPTAVLAGSLVARLAMSGDHGCAITTAQTIECWGANTQGESGVAASAVVDTPSPVSSASGPLMTCTDVAVADEHSCAICDGAAVCWGRSDDRGLTGRGFGSTVAPQTAAKIDLASSHRFVEIEAYDGGGCALDEDGKLFCWGDGTFGENGDGGAGSPVPLPVGVPR